MWETVIIHYLFLSVCKSSFVNISFLFFFLFSFPSSRRIRPPGPSQGARFSYGLELLLLAKLTFSAGQNSFRLKQFCPFLDLLVVAAGFYGVKSCYCVSRELRTPSGTPFYGAFSIAPSVPRAVEIADESRRRVRTLEIRIPF